MPGGARPWGSPFAPSDGAGPSPPPLELGSWVGAAGVCIRHCPWARGLWPQPQLVFKVHPPPASRRGAWTASGAVCPSEVPGERGGKRGAGRVSHSVRVPRQLRFCSSPGRLRSPPSRARALLWAHAGPWPRAAGPAWGAAGGALPAAPPPAPWQPRRIPGRLRPCSCSLVLLKPGPGSAVPRHLRPAGQPGAGRFSRSILGALGVTSRRAGMLLALFVLAPLGFFLHASWLELGRSQWAYK